MKEGLSGNLGSGAFVLQDVEFQLIGAGGSLLLIVHHLHLFLQSMFLCCKITALDLTETQMMCVTPSAETQHSSSQSNAVSHLYLIFLQLLLMCL